LYDGSVRVCVCVCVSVCVRVSVRVCVWVCLSMRVRVVYYKSAAECASESQVVKVTCGAQHSKI